MTKDDALGGVTLAQAMNTLEMNRLLADAMPDRFLPELVASLEGLSQMLLVRGRREEALSALQEALGYYQQLLVADSGRWRPNFGRCLHAVGSLYGASGNAQKAQEITREAIVQFRLLAIEHPQIYRPHLATALANLGRDLHGLGRLTEARSALEESVRLRRALAMSSEVFETDLAVGLTSLAAVLTDLEALRGARLLRAEGLHRIWPAFEAAPQRLSPWVSQLLQGLLEDPEELPPAWVRARAEAYTELIRRTE